MILPQQILSFPDSLLVKRAEPCHSLAMGKILTHPKGFTRTFTLGCQPEGHFLATLRTFPGILPVSRQQAQNLFYLQPGNAGGQR